MKLTKRLKYIVGIGVLFAVALAIMLIARFFSPPTSATLVIEGPASVRNGQEQIFIFRYTNNSNVALQDVELEISLPPSSLVRNSEHTPLVLEKIGTLERGERKSFQLPLTFFGGERETLRFGARLRYQPENATAFFETEQTHDVSFSGSIIEADFEDFTIDASGNIRSTLLLKTHVNDMKNVTVTVLYPVNFRYVGAAPVPRRGTIDEWVFEKLSGTSTSIALFGRLVGGVSSIKPLEARVVRTVGSQEFILARASSIDQIVSSGLVVFQKINNDRPDSVAWGETLPFSVAYKNSTEGELRNALVEIVFNPLLIDSAKSNFGGASYDPGTGIVRFDPQAHRALESLSPGEEGSVSFSIALSVLAPRAGSISKNFVFMAQAKINARTSDGASEIAGVDVIEAKVRTKALFSARVLYNNQYAQNSGPIPPRVGIPTTYTVVWDISNFSNDIRSSSVETFLGPNVSFERIISPQNARIRYNTEMRQVVWDIGNVEAGAGFITPIRFAVFQVSLTPTADQIGQRALLIGQSRFLGIDAFASSSIESSVVPIYSDLPDDPTINKQGTVAQ